LAAASLASSVALAWEVSELKAEASLEASSEAPSEAASGADCARSGLAAVRGRGGFVPVRRGR